MLDSESVQAVRDLATAVLSARPLTDRLEQPVPVYGPPALGPVLDRVTGQLGAPGLAPAPPGEPPPLSPFARVVSDRLDLPARAGPLSRSGTALAEAGRLAAEVQAGDFLSTCRTGTVSGAGGTALPAYAAGPPEAPAVVLASACGMPARLAERWMRHLAADFHVLIWESRGLFGDLGFDGATDVAAQAADLRAVLDHFDVPSAHVAGLCGGAVIALVAAARWPERISSLSLWHGDFDLGPDTPKTDHQRNLQALMAMGARSPSSAQDVHAVVCQSMLDRTPPDLAHLVLYPYATPALFHRYCQLNGAIMEADLRGYLAQVRQPTHVVTSTDDVTAHPDGSRLVAKALPDARLHVLPHGDHISLFRAGAAVLETVTDLVRGG